MGEYQLHQGDLCSVLPDVLSDSIAFVFADIPYQITSCAWDLMLPMAQVYRELSRINAPLECFTAVQPLTSKLITDRAKLFHQELTWVRHQARGFQCAKRRPLRKHENIVLFRRTSATTYNPLRTPTARKMVHTGASLKSAVYGSSGMVSPHRVVADRYPTTVLQFDESDLRHDTLNGHVSKRLHPTQKPLALLQWLIATYTNPGDTVLDPVMGSGTTGHACANLGRRFIGIEKDPTYFATAKARIEAAYADATTGAVQRELAV